ncbi:glycosyltransferase family 4 protein [Microcoleus sp.]|uniref:glycosyltransferase family 4 protein n=1 Tax=Microcoleus sp. TaxID=44472 RepID=UPI0035235386
MQILMLSSTFPYPPSRGGTQVRTFHLLKYLSRRHHVILGTLRSPDVTDAQIHELRQQVAELAVFPNSQIPPQPPLTKGGLRLPPRSWGGTEGGFYAIVGKLGRFAGFLQSGIPPNVLSSYSPAMQNWVDELVTAGKCDAITCEHSVNEIYVRPQWRQKLLTVVNIHSSVWGTCKQILETGTSENPLRDRLNLPLLARYEKRYCAKFSRIVATTSTDKQLLLQLLSPRNMEKRIDYFSMPTIEVIPNGVDLVEFPHRAIDPGGHTLIFAGAMNNLPNIDAARFLSLEILPILQQRYPDTTLTLVGTSPVPSVLALGKLPGIQVLGRVQKVAEYLHQATVCVVPMRIGLGIKNKTLEAMAAGTPIVASDRGLEGLAIGGESQPILALRANEVQEYVEAISTLFENPHLRHELSQNARSHIETQYTWDTIGRQYDRLLDISPKACS